MTDTLTWMGIALCLSQSAIFSGLNLAVFSLSRLRLETAAQRGDRQARRVLALRRNANFALTTILWGNVAINVLLTLLAESVMAGVVAFLFSTVVITLAGERPGDDVIDKDLILLWSDAGRRIITGSDLLGRLLRKIARPADV